MEIESAKVEVKSGISAWLNALGILVIITAIILAVKYGTEESSFLLFLYYLLGGLFSGLFCMGFAKVVNAAHKYLKN